MPDGPAVDYGNSVVLSAGTDRIQTLAKTTPGLQKTEYTQGNMNLWIIGDRPDLPLRQDQVNTILERQRLVDQEGVDSNCHYIASKAAHDGIMTGVLESKDVSANFVGWSAHSVNYAQLSDGRVMSVDFTAGYDIDDNNGNFRTLAVLADNIEGLMAKLSQLYGGHWEITPREEINIAFYQKYGTPEEQIRANRDLEDLLNRRQAEKRSSKTGQ